jgi:hypothetical protein
MTNVETLSLKLARLPEEKQNEVADFIDFLLAKLAPETPADAFDQALQETAGIWPDLPDGVVYEDQLRQQWQGRA